GVARSPAAEDGPHRGGDGGDTHRGPEHHPVERAIAAASLGDDDLAPDAEYVVRGPGAARVDDLFPKRADGVRPRQRAERKWNEVHRQVAEREPERDAAAQRPLRHHDIARLSRWSAWRRSAAARRSVERPRSGARPRD